MVAMMTPESAARVATLMPAMRDLVMQLDRQLALQSIFICVPTDGGLRTAARQNQLYAEGRTVAGRRVTDASGTKGQSNHQYGLAVDVVPYTDDTRTAINWKVNSPQYQRMVAVFKAASLEWGGDWEGNLGDYDHFQWKGLPASPSAAMEADYATYLHAPAPGGSLAAIWQKAMNGLYAAAPVSTH